MMHPAAWIGKLYESNSTQAVGAPSPATSHTLSNRVKEKYDRERDALLDAYHRMG